MMKKLTREDPESKSADLVAENLRALRELFPDAFVEGKVDFEVLRELLGGDVGTSDEKYGLNWHGKRQARRLALTPSTGTLRPRPGESVGWDSTRNLVIEGDNLEVLKLLQKSYANQVKMIYIDPPYNTGRDFVYPDSFADNVRHYLEMTSQADSGGNAFVSNAETSGRFHTAWLNMMLPRLKVARSLLRDDGAIFVTVDDGELGNLLALLNEVFGEENHIATIAWQKKYSVSNNSKGVASMKDNIVLFAKSDRFECGLLPRDDASKARYVNPDDDARGPWKPVDYWNQVSPVERPNLSYSIVNPNTGRVVVPDKKAWKFSREVHDTHVREGRIWWGVDGSNTVPALKLFLSDVRDGMIPHDWWPHEDAGHTDEAKKELDVLFDSKAPFDTPKPTRLLLRMFQVCNVSSDDLVLDFFAGSGTTGHATYIANARDEGRRRFILVQLPEPLANSEYQTIADVTRERLRRGAAALRQQPPLPRADLGFRAFTLDSSNFRAWEPAPEAVPDAVQQSIEHLKLDRTEQDILFEIMLKLGLELVVPIAERELLGTTAYAVGSGALMVCLATAIEYKDAASLALGLVAWSAELAVAGDCTVIFRDSAFDSDATKANLTAILEQHGLRNIRSI